jgi:hypothetical protein
MSLLYPASHVTTSKPNFSLIYLHKTCAVPEDDSKRVETFWSCSILKLYIYIYIYIILCIFGSYCTDMINVIFEELLASQEGMQSVELSVS